MTICNHVERDLGMTSTTGDPALFIKEECNEIDSRLCYIVDDIAMGANEQFQSLTAKTPEMFDAKERCYDSMDFVGVSIKTIPTTPQSVTIGQSAYVEAGSLLPLSVSFDEFQSSRASFGWLAHSRPDLCCSIDRAAQVTDDLITT